MKKSTARQMNLLAELHMLEAQRGLEAARTELEQAEVGLQQCSEDLARERVARSEQAAKGISVIELRLQELRDQELRAHVARRERQVQACERAVRKAESVWIEANTERKRAEKISDRIAAERRAVRERKEREELDEAGARSVTQTH